MKEDTLKITTGAMFIAIFAILLLINRQTGSMFEQLIMYLLPIPMVAYSAKYGVKTGIPVLIAMTLISLIMGNALTIFYAFSEALIGLIFGGCIHKKMDMTNVLFVVMILSVIATVLNVIVLASLFGYDLAAEVAELRTMMTEAFSKSGATGFEELLTTSFLMRLLIISTVFSGALQGFIVFEVSLLILHRLKLTGQKPKSVYLYYPPSWTAFLAIGAYVAYSLSTALSANEKLVTVLQTFGICGCAYLLVFGFIGVLLATRVYTPKMKVFRFVIVTLLMFMFSQLLMMVGAIYIVTDLHRQWVDRLELSGEKV